MRKAFALTLSLLILTSLACGGSGMGMTLKDALKKCAYPGTVYEVRTTYTETNAPGPYVVNEGGVSKLEIWTLYVLGKGPEVPDWAPVTDPRGLVHAGVIWIKDVDELPNGWTQIYTQAGLVGYVDKQQGISVDYSLCEPDNIRSINWSSQSSFVNVGFHKANDPDISTEVLKGRELTDEEIFHLRVLSKKGLSHAVSNGFAQVEGTEYVITDEGKLFWNDDLSNTDTSILIPFKVEVLFKITSETNETTVLVVVWKDERNELHLFYPPHYDYEHLD